MGRGVPNFNKSCSCNNEVLNVSSQLAEMEWLPEMCWSNRDLVTLQIMQNLYDLRGFYADEFGQKKFLSNPD